MEIDVVYTEAFCWKESGGDRRCLYRSVLLERKWRR
jgi:hypothetical protein